MPADLFDRLSPPLRADPPRAVPDAAFAARPRLAGLRDALARAAKRRRGARWNEPVVFFFNRTRQAELEAARPAPTDPHAELTALVTAELPALLAAVEVRRVARATVGLTAAAAAMAPHCPAARELTELLAVPDDEVFLALAPAGRTGVRLHLRGAASVAQLHRLLAPTWGTAFQLFAPAALRTDGTLPASFAGCGHWLWPTQQLASVPRINGERVVLVGPAVVSASFNTEPRFPELAVECEQVETLTAFQVADILTRLCGRPVPVQPPSDVPAVARAA